MADRDDITTLLSGRESLLQVFFYLLWQKTRGKHCLTNICVPDTVILNHSRAIDWYFTAKDGTLKKKSRQKLSSNAIVEHFLKHGKSKSGVNATLITRDASMEEGVATEPIKVAKLRTLLADGIVTGTLQLFVDPKSDSGVTSNHEIVSSWTPNVFYIEKRTNSNNLFSDKVPIEERTAVSETSRFVRVAPLVSSRTTSQLELVCQTIAQHIEGIHGCRVAHLGLHTKIDEHDTVWVLYCSSIRVTRVSPPASVSLTLVPQSASPRGDDQQSGSLQHHQSRGTNGSSTGLLLASTASQRAKEKEVTCALCRKSVTRAASTQIAQKHVLFPLAVMSFLSSNPPGTPFAEEECGDDEVPAHVQLLHPEMTAADYRIHRRDASWEDKPVFLCQNCTAGLESITNSFDIGVDGAIRVPNNRGALSAFMSSAAAASAKNTRHLQPLKKVRHHVGEFGATGKAYDGAELWDDDSTASAHAPLYSYDTKGNAVPRHRKVVPRERAAPGSAPRPTRLQPLEERGRQVDPAQLNKALTKVSPVTQPHRRAASALGPVTPNTTPKQPA